MVEDLMSLCSSRGSEERSVVMHLILITLAGEEMQLTVTVELQEFDRLNEFENAVLQQLPYIGESSTFGCELGFAKIPANAWLAQFGTPCVTTTVSTW